MKISNLLSILFLLTALVFVGCEGDNIDEITPVDPPDVIEKTTNPLLKRAEKRSSGDEIYIGCYEAVTPFSLLHASSAESVINDYDDFEMALTSPDTVVDFVYPLQLIDQDGSVFEVADGQELGQAFVACIPDTGWTGGTALPAFLISDDQDCYELLYPVELLDENGNLVYAQDESEFIDLIATSLHFFNFPMSVLDEDGIVVQVATEFDLFNLLALCDLPGNVDTTCVPSTANGIACYEFQYPVSYLDENGGIRTAQTGDELLSGMLSHGFTGFAFPLNLLDATNQVITVNDDDELTVAVLNCGPIWNYDLTILYDFSTDLNGCYDINYPISTITQGGDINTINSDAELEEALYNSQIGVQYLQYPLSVTLISTSQVIDVTDSDSLQDLIHLCN